MSTCIPSGGRWRRPTRTLAMLVMLLVGMITMAQADQEAQPDRTLRLADVSILPDDPGTQALVMRYLPLAPGEALDVSVLSLARQSLEQSGYFREVTLYTSRGILPGQVVLHVEVELDRKVKFLTGFGYEPMDGWYLNYIGAKLLNRPRSGSEVRIAYRNGYFISGTYLEGQIPVARRDREAWLFDLHFQEKSWFVYDQREPWEQDIKSKVLRVGRQMAIGQQGRFAGWLGISKVNPSDDLESWTDLEDVDRPSGDLIDADFDPQEFVDIWLEGDLANRDKVRPWWQGTWFGWRVRASHDLDGRGFLTAEVDGRTIMPLSDTSSLAIRGRAAHAGEDTPYHQRFQFGGVYSVHGYDFAYLSGAQGAASLVQANLEYRVALLDRHAALPRVAGILFLDNGQCWTEGGDTYGWAMGAGYGVRLRLPWVQYVGLDVSYPVVKFTDISPFVVNFALGWSY